MQIFISENIMHASLISFRNNNLKQLYPNSSGSPRLRPVENCGEIYSWYIYEVMTDERSHDK